MFSSFLTDSSERTVHLDQTALTVLSVVFRVYTVYHSARMYLRRFHYSKSICVSHRIVPKFKQLSCFCLASSILKTNIHSNKS